MYTENVGVLDIGSNTIRLVVYGVDALYNYSEVINIKTPARLSQYVEEVDDALIMSEAGIQILIETLISFKHVADESNISHLFAFATAAVRLSSNQEEILQRIHDTVGIEVRILSGDEEAEYGQYAVAHSFCDDEGLTVDLGGGSCEVTYFKRNELIMKHSFPFGAVSLKNQFFNQAKHNDSNAIEACRKYVKSEIKKISWLKKSYHDIFAIGGSARNIAEVNQRLNNYEMAGLHNYVMEPTDLDETYDLFTKTDTDDLQNIEGLSSDRADIIVPAVIVFQELTKYTRSEAFKISTQGLRDGIIAQYINSHYNYPLDPVLIKTRSIRKMEYDLPLNNGNSQVRSNHVISIYRQLCNLNMFNYVYEQQQELEFASHLYLFGSFISSEAGSESQHTFYLLSNTSLFGFSHSERLRLALLSSYQNRSLFRQYTEDFRDWFSDVEFDQLEKLGGLLKFANALDDSQSGAVTKVKLSREGGNYLLHIYHRGTAVAEKFRTQRHKKHLERALDGKLTLKFISEGTTK